MVIIEYFSRNSRVVLFTVDNSDARWLIGPDGAAALAAAHELEGQLTTRLQRLRAFLPPGRAGLVLEQCELRGRARAKFRNAERMFFTKVGLQQATNETIARYKSRRFEEGSSVLDLCSGIGGDLVALAAIARTTGVDRDPVSATFAEANAHVNGHIATSVLVADVAAIDVANCDMWHLDPDRRPQGRRTTRVELHEPSAEVIDAFLSRNENAAIKLAPAATWPESWNGRGEWEWISDGRECRQLVAWFGSLAMSAGSRRASLVDTDGTASTFESTALKDPPVSDSLSEFLFEPDPAVLAARLTGALAIPYDLMSIAPGIAYLTGPVAVDNRLLSCFEIEESFPLDLKKLKSAFRALDIGTLEIKVRGIEQDPVVVRKQLGLTGSKQRTLFLTRVGQRTAAVLARRVGSDARR